MLKSMAFGNPAAISFAFGDTGFFRHMHSLVLNDVLHWDYALLAGFGLVLTHISVNTLNDYFDYKSGVDLKTQSHSF